jgi:hypothetical protein
MHLSTSLFCLPKSPLPKAPELAALLLTLALPFLLAGTEAQARQPCRMIGARLAQTRIHVELSARKPESAFCIRARKGQHLLAEISNARGGPGGPFFRGECRESGIYRIEVGQRGPKRAGSYDLTVEITPPR